MHKYILDEEGLPVREDDIVKWSEWMDDFSKRIVKQEIINPEEEDEERQIKVSTVFLGIDHNFGNHGIPILYETMIFGGLHDDYQERYATRREALEGHTVAVELAKSVITK